MTDSPETRKAQIRAQFSRLAPVYDFVGCFAYFGPRLVEAVGVEPGQRVLDVASGRGAVLFPAAERVGPDGHAEGIDLAEGMVQAVNADAEARGIAARVRLMDAEQRARAAGKKAGGDMSVTFSLQELILSAGREFVAKHKDDTYEG